MIVKEENLISDPMKKWWANKKMKLIILTEEGQRPPIVAPNIVVKFWLTFSQQGTKFNTIYGIIS